MYFANLVIIDASLLTFFGPDTSVDSFDCDSSLP